LAFEKKKWKLSLSTPYSFLLYNLRQQGDQVLSNTTRNTFNPSAAATYLINPSHQLSADVSTGRRFEELDNFYNGYIINTYRSLRRYDTPLLSSHTMNTGIHYSYKNILKANFAHLGYSYSNGKRDYVFR